MLKYLHIENIAVIESAELELSAGFNAMTGETGAGKSIIIDSLGAVLGQRASRELVRSGCDKACVSALFCSLNAEAIKALEAAGYAPDENGELLISRMLSATGNGSVRINGKPATVGVLRDIGAVLVNIHGQHDNQQLLDPAYHCSYVDRIAENEALRNEYYCEFKKLNSIRRELNALETDNDEKARRIELLEYQIDELENAAIRPGERDELRERLRLSERAAGLQRMLANAVALINGDDTAAGAAQLSAEAGSAVTGSEIEELAEAGKRLTELSYELNEISGDIDKYIALNDFSEIKTDEVRERLDFLHRIMLKYGDNEEKVLSFLQSAKQELQNIRFSDERTARLSDELDASTERLIGLGKRLTEGRMAAARELEYKITEALHYLDMPRVEFKVELKTGRYTKNGCDELQFLISANSGEQARPLSKIASGGELSRVMLAIKSVLADRDEVATLIFDEIDTGISGHAAIRVGEKLRQVAKARQVLCVTHLAQIAAAADRQLLIEKQNDGSRTFTSVSALSREQRIGELARIMSGGELTDNLLKSAKELLDRRNGNDNL